MSHSDTDASKKMDQILNQLSSLSETVRKIEHIYLNTEFLRRRTSTYIGANTAITYLEDETPIYVNSNDFGPPSNFINGGAYEPENLDVLMSFVRDDTVFLDIGANLGFYSLKVAQRNKAHGKVHAFEPHPTLVRLARASSYLNGFSQLAADDGLIVVHQCALGNTNGEVTLSYPSDHLGGGGLGGPSAGSTAVATQVHRLDDFFPADFTFDLAKIDVEGFETEVLMGMRQLIERSPNPILLFEKLGLHCGYEKDIEALLESVGLTLFGISSGSMLHKIIRGELAAYSGYVVATRDTAIEINRNQFRIYPRQLMTNAACVKEISRDNLVVSGHRNEILFHGPYWYLARGLYRVTIEGSIKGIIELTIAHHFGYAAATVVLTSERPSADFIVDMNLIQFELVCRPKDKEASVTLENIKIMRLA